MMYDSQGKVLSQATPSIPVEVLGWRELPSAGDEVFQVTSEVCFVFLLLFSFVLDFFFAWGHLCLACAVNY